MTVTSLSEVLALTAVVIAGAMLALWLISLVVRNASIVDLFWGLGFVIIAWVSWLTVSGGAALWFVTVGDAAVEALGTAGGTRRVVLLVLVTGWGLRLTAYLAWRNVGKGEDFRYREMRQRWGRRFPLVSLGTVFGLQGVLMWVVSMPVQGGMFHGGSLGVLGYTGIALWAVGLAFETVGDVQLARFKSDPANARAVMDRGLWRYTRHPNYFGDFCVWWGIFGVAATTVTWWTVVGPMLMTLLLLRFSGVALLEWTITSRRPGYAQYAQRTNAFFPGRSK